jgi:hypothetical protein
MKVMKILILLTTFTKTNNILLFQDSVCVLDKEEFHKCLRSLFIVYTMSIAEALKMIPI